MAQGKKSGRKSSSGFAKEISYRLDFFSDEFIDISSESAKEIGFTAMDIYENNENIYVQIELAGVDPRDISVTVSENRLIIEGMKNEPPTRQPGLIYHCAECSFGAFRRMFVLGSAIDSQNIEAAYRNGILKIEIPKVHDRRNTPHAIKVKVYE
ncbi:MAG: Hsp20/alpha crystallin family protein [Nitrospinota bacterium]